MSAKKRADLDEPLEVTSNNFERLLVKSARQMAAIARGELEPARETFVTARVAEVVPAPEYSASRIKAVRAKLGVSQAVFADALGVSLGTARAWERGGRVPEGAARRILQVAELHPEFVYEVVRTEAGRVHAKSKQRKAPLSRESDKRLAKSATNPVGKGATARVTAARRRSQ